MTRLSETEILESANKHMKYYGNNLDVKVEHIDPLAEEGENYEHLAFRWTTPEGELIATMNDVFIKDVSTIPMLIVEEEFRNKGFYTWMCGAHTRFVRPLGIKRVDITIPTSLPVWQMHVDAGFSVDPDNPEHLYVEITEETTQVEKYSSDRTKEAAL